MDIKKFRDRQKMSYYYFEEPLDFHDGYITVVGHKPNKTKVTHIFRCPESVEVMQLADDTQGKEEIEPAESRKRKRQNDDDIEGHLVAQITWNQFKEYINSPEELVKLKREELLELCHSLNSCQNYSVNVGGSNDKLGIAEKLSERANEILNLSGKEKFVPMALGTIYCSKFYCDGNVPQNVSEGRVALSPGYRTWMSNKRQRIN